MAKVFLVCPQCGLRLILKRGDYETKCIFCEAREQYLNNSKEKKEEPPEK